MTDILAKLTDLLYAAVPLVTALTALVAAIAALMGYFLTRKVETNVNSRLTELLKVTAVSAHAEGKLEGNKERLDHE